MATIVAGGEEDSSVGLGWHGHWVTALLANRNCRQPLGERTEIVWNHHAIDWDSEAIETGGQSCVLKSIQRRQRNLLIVEIASYEVQVTVLRVFVKSEWFNFEQTEDPQEHEEDGDVDEDGYDEDMYSE
ncbi:hypothetical protein DFH08DRAFT_929277 [Mycena albidolilacea]|uniref:Uncharacterized protein n=1 Tax=Mycena albidolilacea TaxID=1033008 RepID=A0AAD7F4D3_9AGAR|nr:hypothetical protein DFH08DRAFT_929277 [Mycena albidolilacea]